MAVRVGLHKCEATEVRESLDPQSQTNRRRLTNERVGLEVVTNMHIQMVADVLLPLQWLLQVLRRLGEHICVEKHGRIGPLHTTHSGGFKSTWSE